MCEHFSVVDGLVVNSVDYHIFRESGGSDNRVYAVCDICGDAVILGNLP